MLVAACSGGSHSVPYSGPANTSLSGQAQDRFHTPSPQVVQGKRSVLSLDPDTNDVCATNPPGWRCIVQAAAPYTGGGYYMGIASGQTAVCGSATTDIPNVQMTTFPTSITYPTQICNNTITVPAGATVGNNATYAISGSISGSCSGGNYCGNFTLNGSFEIECSLTNKHCPLETVTDTNLGSVVSGSPPPVTNWIVGLQKICQERSPAVREPTR
jgi:hypothetical protein